MYVCRYFVAVLKTTFSIINCKEPHIKLHVCCEIQKKKRRFFLNLNRTKGFLKEKNFFLNNYMSLNIKCSCGITHNQYDCYKSQKNDLECGHGNDKLENKIFLHKILQYLILFGYFQLF